MRCTSRIAAVLGFCLLSTLAVGCREGVSRLDRRDRASPLLARAQDEAGNGRTEAAVQLYEKALKVNPGLAAGHLDLAMLLHDDVGDYVGAICHYRLYLDLRPDAAKSDMIQNRMNDAVIRLAASAREADNGLAKDAGESLLRENEALRQEIRRLRAAASQEGGRVAVTNTLQTVGSAADGAVRPAGPRQYVVKSGDTLGTIARDMYGNVAEWKKIHAANKEALSGPDLLVVGQVLMIP